MHITGLIITGMLLLVSCARQSPSTSVSEMKTYKGTAQNAKGGAVLVADDKNVYYIGGLDQWEEKFLNKRVVVEGKVEEQKLFPDPVGPDGEIRQGAEGTQTVIVSAKWKLE